jgi:invasion protein IalB
MDERITSARARRCARGATVAATVLSLFAGSAALAQQPAPPAAPPRPAVKPPPRPAAPAAKPAEQPQPQSPSQQQAAAADMPPLTYSPWTKMCGKNQDTGGKQVCVILKDGRIDAGNPIVVLTVYEREGEPRGFMRVTVPLGVQLQNGTRLIIDQNAPQTAPYVACIPNGCMADYPADPDTIAKMKKGQIITIQAINLNGQGFNLPLPLSDFAKAYDGPATDPKVFEEQQRKMQEDMVKKAQSSAQPTAPTTPPKQ